MCLPFRLLAERKGQINWIMKNENQNPQKQNPVCVTGWDPKGIQRNFLEGKEGGTVPTPHPRPRPQSLLLTFHSFPLVVFQLAS